MQKNLIIAAAILALSFGSQMRLEGSVLTITCQPDSENLYAGRTAQFTVKAGGDAPFGYQWLANGVDLSDGGNVLGATNASLTISDVSATNVGSYQVVVTNSSGAITSSVAALNLVAPFSSNTVTYENAVMQANPVAYWRLNETNNPAIGKVVACDYWGGYNGVYGVASSNGVPGPCPANGINLFESTNTAVLVTANTPDSCVVVPALNLNTNTVTITCWLNPTTATQADYAGVIFCRSGSTSCGLAYNNNVGTQLGFNWNNAPESYNWASGLAPPAGQWSFVALVVTSSSATLYVYNTNSQGSASLAIANAVQAFAGPTYLGTDPYTASRTFNGTIDEVAVFNYAMTPSQVGQLYSGASFNPIITNQPVSEEVYEGQSSQFTVGALSSSALYYQWQTNNVDLSDGGNISGSTTATLTISNVSATNVASYQVVVSNVWGAVTSSVATLALVPPINAASESNLLAANPVAFWQLNEMGDPASGTLRANDFWGGHSGVYGSAVTLGIPGPQGLEFPGFDSANTAMQLTTDTADCWVTVPPLNLDTNAVTITCWIEPEVNIQPGYAGLVFCRDGGTAAGLGFDSSGAYLGYTWNNDPGTYSWNSGLTPPVNQWSFVALVVTPNNAILYLYTANGVQSATNYYPQGYQNFGGSSLIGNDPYNSPSRVFGGAIEEVAVFNYALTPTQMGQLPAIIYPPTAAINPLGQPQPLYAGNSYEFRVIAQGTPPLTYQWYSNSVPIPQATNTSLNFASLGTNDSGSYTVQVTNLAGSSTSPAAVLLVYPPPIAQNAVAGTVQNQPVTVSTASLLAQASDPYGDALSVVAVTDSTNGATVLLEGDQIIYTPLTNFVGADCFTYTISDTLGATACANVMVSVVSSNAMFTPPASAPKILANGCFHVDYLGVPYNAYTVETATNLSGPWTFLTNLTGRKQRRVQPRCQHDNAVFSPVLRITGQCSGRTTVAGNGTVPAVGGASRNGIA